MNMSPIDIWSCGSPAKQYSLNGVNSLIRKKRESLYIVAHPAIQGLRIAHFN